MDEQIPRIQSLSEVDRLYYRLNDIEKRVYDVSGSSKEATEAIRNLSRLEAAYRRHEDRITTLESAVNANTIILSAIRWAAITLASAGIALALAMLQKVLF